MMPSVFIGSCSECLEDHPQRQNRRPAVEEIARDRLGAERAVLAAEHVRHHEEYSGR